MKTLFFDWQFFLLSNLPLIVAVAIALVLAAFLGWAAIYEAGREAGLRTGHFLGYELGKRDERYAAQRDEVLQYPDIRERLPDGTTRRIHL